MSEPRILALDLGTHTGWVVQSERGEVTTGTEDWPIHKLHREYRMDRRADPRVIQFFSWLRSSGTFDIVIWEDVEFSRYTYQTQLWSSFRTAVWLAFGERHDTFMECVPVKSLKKFATGNGDAEKIDMARALIRKFPSRFTWPEKTCKQVRLFDTTTKTLIDDNAIDAYFLLLWAKTFIKR